MAAELLDPPAPAAPAVPAAPGGISSLLSQLDAAVDIDSGKAPPAPKPDPAATATAAAAAPKPDPATPPKPPIASATAAKVEPAEDPNAEPDWTKAPPKWHKIYEGHKAKTGATIKSLETKIAEIEAKAKESPADAGRIAALEKQIADLGGEAKTAKQKLAERDFWSSDEYQKNYVDKGKRIYVSGVQKALLYPAMNDDGTPRASTQADFDGIRMMPAGPGRDEQAKAVYGDVVAGRVLQSIEALDTINEDARIAAEEHGKNYEQTTAQKAAAEAESQKKWSAAFQQHYKSALTAIQDNPEYGKWFKPNESDPEMSKLLQDGFEEIERMAPTLGALPVEQQAAYSAVYRARAAATPVLITEINRLQKKHDAVVAELEALRGNDPSKLGGKSGAAPAADAKPGGIKALAAQFDVQ